MPPGTSHTLPVITSRVPTDPLPLSVSSPDARHSEFSTNLEQSFAWTPPDLTMSSQSGPSIVALSPSEVVQLGLSRFLDDSISSQLAQASNSGAGPFVTHGTQKSCSCSSSRLQERIHGLESRCYDVHGHQSAASSSRLGPCSFRHAMDQSASLESCEHPQLHSVPRMPLACNNLLSSIPSSSVLFAPGNGRGASRAGPPRAGYHQRPSETFRRHASFNDNRSTKCAVGHEPCSDIRNDDTPSALDFHINTFPSSTTRPNNNPRSSYVAVTRQDDPEPTLLRPDTTLQRVLSFSHTTESPSTSFLQSLGTSESLSLSPTYSDQVDINRRLIYFPSPTFSLSRFPSTLSSPIFGSSEVSESSGDGGAVLPSNWGTRDIIIDMRPISAESANDISIPEVPQSTQHSEPKHRSSVAEKVMKLGEKLKRMFLKKIRSSGAQGEKPGDGAQPKNVHHKCPGVNDEGTSAPLTPPSLPQQDRRKRILSNLTQLLNSNINDTVPDPNTTSAVIETDYSMSQDMENPSDIVGPPQDGALSPEPKPMEKKFSLSIFAQPSRKENKQKRSRPKSMPDLSDHCHGGGALGDSSMQNDPDVVPKPCIPDKSARGTNRQSKRLSLQFLRDRF